MCENTALMNKLRLILVSTKATLRRSQWVEVTLVQSGFTISRTPLSSEDTVMIDATEVQINRLKKLANDSGKKKFHAMKAQAIVTSQGELFLWISL